MTEFEIIDKYLKKLGHFKNNKFLSKDSFIGIGDDGAVLPLAGNEETVVSTDTMVEGTHFLAESDPSSVGQKLLSVNVSDIAAMGAEPVCFTLNLTLYEYNHLWLTNFCEGLSKIAVENNCPLVGGDITKGKKGGSKVLSVTILGLTVNNKVLRRDSLNVGDDIWISGDLGEVSTALSLNKYSEKLNFPRPRLELARKIRNFASSAIDISDGLSTELAHMLFASSKKQNRNFCIEIYFDAFENCLSPWMRVWLKGRVSNFDLCKIASASGDEYELCFSASKRERNLIKKLSEKLKMPLTLIGEVFENSDSYRFKESVSSSGVVWLKSKGEVLPRNNIPESGYLHFFNNS
ncbi:MAG: thiamine-phosphate kinase [Betaproteobacteria bacterium TMED82]|nr:MAG: thiamine-phosphate kinase [Betaproteobacteria bacterium TMED82]|tara:strand:- start:43626 stop:44672 length:1047 start_codon:yes stop_codon:yes gene_type:complete